ncbi:MAG: sulfatase-like hydrolase/transferase [Acidobacteriota bacterium]
MDRRNFLRTTGVGAAALSMGSHLFLTSCKAEKQPNIVLIMADDLGYEGLSCNGSTSYKTPNLDKLAENGVRFTNCFSTPLCTPSRVQIMTGMYNQRNYTEFGTMPKGEITFAHLLKEEGYSTCVAGKWQLIGHYKGSGYKGAGTHPKQNGFDEYCLWQLDKFGPRYWKPLLNTNGKYQQYGKDQYGPDIVCNFILDYIDRHRNSPFLVYYPMILTHDPFVPTPDSSFTEEEKYKNNPVYFKDMVEYTDKIVGRIIDKLEQNNLRENTLIIFVGDNGTHNTITTRTGESEISGDKGKTTTAGTHVPMISSWKKHKRVGLTCEDLIDFTDFLPTLLESAGEKNYQISHKDGQSFLPQIKGESGKPRDWIYCYFDPKWGDRPKRRYAQNKRWKLYDNGHFFDLKKDPLEQNPITGEELSSEMRDNKNRLQIVLDKMKQI